jgi:hypothetical protein
MVRLNIRRATSKQDAVTTSQYREAFVVITERGNNDRDTASRIANRREVLFTNAVKPVTAEQSPVSRYSDNGSER